VPLVIYVITSRHVVSQPAVAILPALYGHRHYLPQFNDYGSNSMTMACIRLVIEMNSGDESEQWIGKVLRLPPISCVIIVLLLHTGGSVVHSKKVQAFSV
jgi:hypothetical protein